MLRRKKNFGDQELKKLDKKIKNKGNKEREGKSSK